ncbi:I78 family peptidase inhibitor [Cognatishimia sp. MH4019]|uniref:I78 family peptidase inhibitor n=1 Tax=Cognatishimia sp. MH4019 TaxID=2854030 RepID=UPI001CD5BDA1|nr:I78 family peptidase inhibitor [Cognatishimia sp. MH4019]
MKRMLLCLPLMACAVAQPAAPDMPSLPTAAEDTCNARAQAGLIGADRDTLESTLILQPVRIITPGMAVTMDFLPTRLNIALNEAERVVRLSCG